MKVNELLAEEKRDKYCSDKCCGSDVKAEDCKCPPTCKHCNCNDPTISERRLSSSSYKLGKKVAKASGRRTKHKLRRNSLGEEATAGATSAGNIASVANPVTAKAKIKRDKNGVPTAPQKKNSDGTAKNALDLSNNLMGGKAIKR